MANLVIFITLGETRSGDIIYKYNDDILTSKRNNLQTQIMFNGMKKRDTFDRMLVDPNTIIHVVYRQKAHEPFRYLGSVSPLREIVNRRDVANGIPLKVKFIVNDSRNIMARDKLLDGGNFRGPGKFKRRALQLLNLRGKSEKQVLFDGIVECVKA